MSASKADNKTLQVMKSMSPEERAHYYIDKMFELVRKEDDLKKERDKIYDVHKALGEKIGDLEDEMNMDSKTESELSDTYSQLSDTYCQWSESWEEFSRACDKLSDFYNNEKNPFERELFCACLEEPSLFSLTFPDERVYINYYDGSPYQYLPAEHSYYDIVEFIVFQDKECEIFTMLPQIVMNNYEELLKFVDSHVDYAEIQDTNDWNNRDFISVDQLKETLHKHAEASKVWYTDLRYRVLNPDIDIQEALREGFRRSFDEIKRHLYHPCSCLVFRRNMNEIFWEKYYKEIHWAGIKNSQYWPVFHDILFTFDENGKATGVQVTPDEKSVFWNITDTYPKIAIALTEDDLRELNEYITFYKKEVEIDSAEEIDNIDDINNDDPGDNL